MLTPYLKYRFVCAMAALLFWLPATGHGKLSDSMKYELKRVSFQLFEEKNRHFLIVDAIIDGVIKPGEPYTFVYQDSTLTINTKKLPAPLDEQYRNKIRSYFLYTNTGSKHVISNSFSFYDRRGTTLKQIFDTHSELRKRMESSLDAIDSTNRKYQQIVQLMQRNGLIDTSKDYTIRYNILGLYINEQRIGDSVAGPCIKEMNKLGCKPTDKVDMLYIDRSQTSWQTHE